MATSCFRFLISRHPKEFEGCQARQIGFLHIVTMMKRIVECQALIVSRRVWQKFVVSN